MADTRTVTTDASRVPFCVFIDAGCPHCQHRCSGRTREAVVAAAGEHGRYAHPGEQAGEWSISRNELHRVQTSEAVRT